MPELPEVETIRRELDKILKGEKIREVKILFPKTIRGSAFVFQKILRGLNVLGISRRAKLIVINFSKGKSVIIHLKMTGQLIYVRNKIIKIGGHPTRDAARQLPNKFTRLVFFFKNGAALYFNDIRKFGYVQLFSTAELVRFFEKNKYGPEPLENEFTLLRFKEMLLKRKTVRIKPLLMDQTFLAGIGNIYAVESCFAAGIRPTRRAGSLSSREVVKLYKSLKAILIKAIKKRGTSSNTYVDAYGNPGGYVPSLKVYGRAGDECLKCGTEIKNLTLGGRSTAYCQKCQR